MSRALPERVAQAFERHTSQLDPNRPTGLILGYGKPKARPILNKEFGIPSEKQNEALIAQTQRLRTMMEAGTTEGFMLQEVADWAQRELPGIKMMRPIPQY